MFLFPGAANAICDASALVGRRQCAKNRAQQGDPCQQALVAFYRYQPWRRAVVFRPPVVDAPDQAVFQREKSDAGLRVRFHRYGVRDGGADVAGYSWEELDTLLDKLQNPSELKAAAVAVTIRKILEDGELRFTSQYNETSPALIKAREHWTRQAEDRVKIAVELLKFDLDADGEVDDSERAVSHANIWRG